MKQSKLKKQKRDRRHARIRAKVTGTSEMPRLSVFKSNTALYAQLIDDVAEKTLASSSTRKIAGKTGLEKARNLGGEIAKKATAIKIKKAVFDRGGYIYTGKVQAVAEGAREGGLKF
jgi:large subunit ribosomal protein L18